MSQDSAKYPAGWRLLHWVIAALVLCTIPIGIWMAQRASIDLFDTLTNQLYAYHKVIGFNILLLMVLRTVVRLSVSPPAYPASMSPRLQKLAKGLHHLLYVMLIVTPLLGWAGVTAFPALVISDTVRLPAMPGVPQDQALATTLFKIHGIFAITLAVLVLGHIGAAIRHMLRRDGIIQRML